MSDLPPPLSDVSDDYFPSGEAPPQDAAVVVSPAPPTATPPVSEQDGGPVLSTASTPSVAASSKGGESSVHPAAPKDDSTLPSTIVARVEPSHVSAFHPPDAPPAVCGDASSSASACGGRRTTFSSLDPPMHDTTVHVLPHDASTSATAAPFPASQHSHQPVLHVMVDHMLALTAVSILYLEPIMDAYVSLASELLEAPPTMDRLLNASVRLTERAQHAVIASAHRIEFVLGLLLFVVSGATVLLRWRFRKYEGALQCIRQQAACAATDGGGDPTSSARPTSSLLRRSQQGAHPRAHSVVADSGSSRTLET